MKGGKVEAFVLRPKVNRSNITLKVKCKQGCDDVVLPQSVGFYSPLFIEMHRFDGHVLTAETRGKPAQFPKWLFRRLGKHDASVRRGKKWT